jgi:hypothetical protein
MKLILLDAWRPRSLRSWLAPVAEERWLGVSSLLELPNACTFFLLPSKGLVLQSLSATPGPCAQLSALSPIEKYVQSGCWNTSALTLASGSIMKPSVNCTPISSGRRSFQIPAWSSRFGHAG